jgi:hypothetical protein
MEAQGKNDNWKYIAGLIGIGLLYWWLIKPKKKGEKYSNFIGSPFGKRVAFTLKNPTDKMQVVPMFNAYSNTQNSSVSITPSMAEFNRTLLNEPKLVKAIEIRAIGGTKNNKQAEKPIQVFCKDASGEYQSSYIHPMISAYQVQKGMTTVTPNNLVLSGQCYFNYTVNPKQTVVMIVHYDVAPEGKKQEVTRAKQTV